MSTPPKKLKRIMHSLHLTEISAVERPAQEGARALLIKSADYDSQGEPLQKVVPPSLSLPPTPNPAPSPGRQPDPQSDMNTITKNATAFAMGTEPVKFTKQQYDEATLAIAKAERRQDESEAEAMTRLMFDERDPRMEALSRAAMFAPKATAKAAEQPVTKTAQDAAWEQMQRCARTGARQGETVEMAMDRLLMEGDVHMAAAAHAYYMGQ